MHHVTCVLFRIIISNSIMYLNWSLNLIVGVNYRYVLVHTIIIYEMRPLEVCWLVLVSGGYYYHVVLVRVKAVKVDGQSSQMGMD